MGNNLLLQWQPSVLTLVSKPGVVDYTADSFMLFIIQFIFFKSVHVFYLFYFIKQSTIFNYVGFNLLLRENLQIIFKLQVGTMYIKDTEKRAKYYLCFYHTI